MTDGFGGDALGVRAVQVNQTREFMLSGELDLGSAAALTEQLCQGPSGCTRLVVDLRDLTFIDSSGIRALVSAKQHCVENGTEFELLLSDSPVKRILLISDFGDFFGIT